MLRTIAVVAIVSDLFMINNSTRESSCNHLPVEMDKGFSVEINGYKIQES